MKKLFILLTCAGCFSSVYAGMPGNSIEAPSGVNLFAADSVGVWSLGLEALYVEPSSDRELYVRQFNTVSPTSPPFFVGDDDYTVNSSFHLGGTVDLTYMFPGNSRDVKLSYTEIDMHNTSTTRNGFNQTLVVPFDNITTTYTTGGSVAKASEDDDYQSADLVFGQWIKIGSMIDLHPFAGLRYTNLEDTFKAPYTGVTSITTGFLTLVDTVKMKTDFSGIGPRAGFDAAWHIYNGFSLVGTIGASLLVGDMDSKITEVNQTSLVAHTTVKNELNTDTHVVPEIDARLGIDHLWNWNSAFSMNLQLGYEIVHYFNILENDYDDIVTPNNVVSTQDFAYQGPYLRLQFNLA